MSERLRELLDLPSTVLFDIDVEGRLLVGNDASGTTQLAEIDPDGGWRWLTDLGEPCTGRYLPGRREVVLSVDDSGTERAQLYRLDIGTGPDLGEPRPLVTDPEYIHTLLDVAAGRLLYATNRRNRVDFDVVLRELETGAEQVVWQDGGWFEEGRISPDGRRVVLGRLTLLPASTELLLVDVTDGSAAPITDAAEPGQWSNARWLDADTVLSSSDSGGEFASLRAYDVHQRTWSHVITDPQRDVSGWPSPDGTRLAVVTTQDGADELRVYRLRGTQAHDDEYLMLPRAGVITFRTALVWSPDSAQLGFTFASPVSPPDVYVWPGSGQPDWRTRAVDPEQLADLVDPVSATVPARDGEQIPTYVLTPAEPDGSAVLVIHGGPEAASVRSWNPVIAALAVQGHTVVVPNVRGSAGYGRRWVSLDDVDKRLDSVADLADLHAWLPTIGVDPARAALYGGSYGGYMVLAGLAFQPELWAAGIDIVGVSSLVTFLENTSAYRRAYREREYGRLDRDREMLEHASPIRAVDAIRAPLLVIHGANDPRVPLSEAEQLVAGVRSRGLDCPLLVYPDEGHGLAKRANRLDAYPQVFEFLARHLSVSSGA